MIKILHVITGLDTGGAETSLIQTVSALDPNQFTSTVVSLRDVVGSSALKGAGIEVMSLHMRPGAIPASALWRLASIMRRVRPDIVQTWLYHADLVGSLAAIASRVPQICWNVRCADLETADHARSVFAIRRLLAWLSPVPARIIVNSVAGQRAHAAIGYRPRAWEVIPNGFDTKVFAPSAEGRVHVRRNLRVGPSTPLVGIVARWHPMKDHATFARAAAIVHSSRPDVRFVLAGRGMDVANAAVGSLMASHGLTDVAVLCGEVSDAPHLFASLDVAVSSSYSEAMPNVVGEAMASGTVCVVTDAGDSARLVGDAGMVVPVRDPEALARAILSVLTMTEDARRDLGLRGRRRIETEFSMKRSVARYAQVYEDLATLTRCVE